MCGTSESRGRIRGGIKNADKVTKHSCAQPFLYSRDETRVRGERTGRGRRVREKGWKKGKGKKEKGRASRLAGALQSLRKEKHKCKCKRRGKKIQKVWI